MINQKEKLLEYLKGINKKFTLERQEVLDAILLIADTAELKHFNAKDIHKEIKVMKSPLSIATVYRTLPMFSEAGIIAEIAKRKGKMIYELITKEKHHDHIICCCCGEVTEFYSPKIEALQKKISNELGFEMIGHSHSIKGICKSCKK